MGLADYFGFGAQPPDPNVQTTADAARTAAALSSPVGSLANVVQGAWNTGADVTNAALDNPDAAKTMGGEVARSIGSGVLPVGLLANTAAGARDAYKADPKGAKSLAQDLAFGTTPLGGVANIVEGVRPGTIAGAIPEPPKQGASNAEPGSPLVYPGSPAPAMPTFKTIGAHEQPLTDPKRQAEMQKAFGEEGEALKGEQTAGRGVANAEAELETSKAAGHMAIGDRQAENAAENEHEANKRAHEAERKIASFEKASAAIANEKEDPSRWWANKSTGEKIGLHVATFLGGFSQAFNKLGSNGVVDQINREVDRDIAAQRSDFEKKKGGLANMQHAYAEAYRITGDKNEAHAVARSMALENVKRQAEAMISQSTSDVQRAKGEQLVAQLDREIASTKERGVKEGMSENKWVPAQTVQTGGFGTGIGAKDQDLIFNSGGQSFMARTKESREQLANQAGVVKNIRDLSNRLEKVSASNYAMVPGTAEYNEAKAINLELQTQVREAGHMGVYKESEIPLFQGMLGDPNMPFSKAGARAQQMAARAESAHRAQLQSQGVLPVQTGYARDPRTGAVVPVAGYTGGGTNTVPKGFVPNATAK